MRVNSQPFSEDQQEKDYSIPSGASLSEQPNTGNYTGDQAGIIGDKVTRDIGSKSSLEDVMMMSDNNDDNYESSFWITSADDFLINPNYSSYYYCCLNVNYCISNVRFCFICNHLVTFYGFKMHELIM